MVVIVDLRLTIVICNMTKEFSHLIKNAFQKLLNIQISDHIFLGAFFVQFMQFPAGLVHLGSQPFFQSEIV